MSVYIVGYSIVPGGRHYDKGLMDLFAESFLRAWDACGNVDVDFIVVASALSDVVSEQLISSSYMCEYLSLERVPSIRIELGDCSSSAALHYAYNMVKHGVYDVVAVVGVEKAHDVISSKLTKFLSYMTDSDHEAYLGITPLSLAALVAREYLRRYGYTYEEYSSWVVEMHRRGLNNQYAYIRRSVKIEDVLSSEIVSDPLRLYDVSPIVDGASCIILSRRPLRRDFKIIIERVMMEAYNVHLNQRDDIALLHSTAALADKLHKELEPSSKALFEVHDTYSILGVLAVESLRLCGRGECIKLIRDCKFGAGDRYVVNASGGLKSMGYPVGASGLYQLVMIVMELLGDKAFKELAGYDVGIVHDMAGIDRASAITMLRRLS